MTLLRIIEDTLPLALADTLELHAAACRVDGCVTLPDVYVPKAGPSNTRGVVDIAERIIWPAIEQHDDLHVFVIGDVPVPRSGLSNNPDGHGDTTGAYPCPSFWASGGMTGWSDTGDNTGYPSKPVFEHGSDDCVFDQDRIPVSAKCSIGLLNLKSVSPRSWGLSSSPIIDAYKRYFDWNLRWRRGDVRVRSQFGCGAYNSAFNTAWVNSTDVDQYRFRSASVPSAIEERMPFGALYDFKALPNNGDFWFKRELPVAAFYLEWESYQTNFPCSRIINPLMTGSVCAAPVGWMFDMTGWSHKTVGQLWRQSATAGKQTFIALYGDPTFRIPSTTH